METYCYILTIQGLWSGKALKKVTISGTISPESGETREQVLDQLLIAAKQKWHRYTTSSADQFVTLFFSLEKNTF